MKTKQEREYRIINFKLKSETQKKEGYLEGIQEMKRTKKNNKIVISNWIDHKSSLHIRFIDYKGNSQIYDSGVIEQLCRVIQYLKKNGIKKDVLDSLIVINHQGEFY